MQRSRVDLPEPDGPISTTTSRGRISKLMFAQHVQLAEPLVDAFEPDDGFVHGRLLHHPTTLVRPLRSFRSRKVTRRIIGRVMIR